MSGTTLLQGPPPPPLPPQHQPPPPRYNLSNFDVSVSSIWNNRSVGTTVQAAPPTPTPAPLPYSGNRLQIWNGSSSLNMGYGHPPPSIDFHVMISMMVIFSSLSVLNNRIYLNFS